MSVLITQPRQQIKFADGNAFQLELRRRVEEYFRTTGRRPRDCWQMYLKTAILLAGFAVSYTLLVFADQTWWQGLLLAVLLGLLAAGIGFNIQHDGGHQAYSNHPWVDKLMAMTLELIGRNSHLWAGETRGPPSTPFHIERPVTPTPIGVVPLCYGVAGLVAGMALSVVFQVAHCVAEAEFPLPREDTGRVEHAWAIHQAETTVDFARRSRVVAWLIGGLNFQIEHHLFPRLCHVNYPAISKLVEETCREFGIKYTEHRSFRGGLASHFRWRGGRGMPTTKSGDPGAWRGGVDSKSAPRVRPAGWSRRGWPRSSMKRTSRSSPGKA